MSVSTCSYAHDKASETKLLCNVLTVYPNVVTYIPSWYYDYNTLYVERFEKNGHHILCQRKLNTNNSIKIIILTMLVGGSK